jgi:hypothetical protein
VKAVLFFPAGQGSIVRTQRLSIHPHMAFFSSWCLMALSIRPRNIVATAGAKAQLVLTSLKKEDDPSSAVTREVMLT